jgi:signal transduction histidine kinase
MLPPASNWPLGSRAQPVLLLRWVLITATSYLVVFSRPLAQNPTSTAVFVAVYFASNLVLAWLIPRFRSQYAFDVSMVLFDTAMVTVGLALTGAASSEFYVVYFLVMFVSALTERLPLVVVAAVLISVAHLYTESHFIGRPDVLNARYIVRVPFLFVVALFFGYLVEDARGRERADDEARTRQHRMEFLSGVSHDLKNPLGVIQSLADLLLEGNAGALTEQQANLVRRIHATARRGITFALNLVDAARIETGRLVLKRRLVGVQQIVEDALSLVRSAGDLKGLTLRCMVEPDLPAVWVDPVQMERVLCNLVGNAIKFTPPAGKVNVLVRRRGDQVILLVCDDGPGIPSHELATIFQKYRSPTSSVATDSSGFGLFIVKGIVEAHGGTVQIDSAPGRGTTATVSLPLLGLQPPRVPNAALRASSHRWWRQLGAHAQ